jgi:hypothetical protein
VNPKIAAKWMFIPLKMLLIGIDPYPNGDITNPEICGVYENCLQQVLLAKIEGKQPISGNMTVMKRWLYRMNRYQQSPRFALLLFSKPVVLYVFQRTNEPEKCAKVRFESIAGWWFGT